jgi:hypothetical protein
MIFPHMESDDSRLEVQATGDSVKLCLFTLDRKRLKGMMLLTPGQVLFLTEQLGRASSIIRASSDNQAPPQ